MSAEPPTSLAATPFEPLLLPSAPVLPPMPDPMLPPLSEESQWQTFAHPPKHRDSVVCYTDEQTKRALKEFRAQRDRFLAPTVPLSEETNAGGQELCSHEHMAR